MNIDLCFQGWLRDVEIDTVYVRSDDVKAAYLYDLCQDDGSDKIWLVHPEDRHRVEILTPAQLLAKLQSGEFTLSLARALDNAGNSNVEIHDIEETR